MPAARPPPTAPTGSPRPLRREAHLPATAALRDEDRVHLRRTACPRGVGGTAGRSSTWLRPFAQNPITHGDRVRVFMRPALLQTPRLAGACPGRPGPPRAIWASLRSLDEQPGDLATWSAYSDWLQDQAVRQTWRGAGRAIARLASRRPDLRPQWRAAGRRPADGTLSDRGRREMGLHPPRCRKRPYRPAAAPV